MSESQHVEVARVSIAVLVNIATGFFVYAVTLQHDETSGWYVIVSLFACIATLAGAVVVAMAIGEKE